MTISIKPTASGSTIEQDGSTILTVDGSGNITTENNLTVSGRIQSTTQPAFFTSAEASQTNGGVSNGTHVISWTPAITDTTSSFDSTNNKYVAPVNGLYAFNAIVTWFTSGVSARYIRAFLRINGSIYAGNLTHISNETSDADYTSATISCVANLSANDEIQIVWGTATTSTVGIYNTTRATTFSGYLIG
jgi:hypothetical protein